jgi:CHASE3 domain sensor protein
VAACPHIGNAIIEWLAEKDQEKRRVNTSPQAEQNAIARRASEAAERQAAAAERANARATVAIILAVICSVIVAVVAALKE